MIDPMLATGGSASAALELLRRGGARQVRIVCIVAAPEGIAFVERDHPDVEIYTPVVDRASERPEIHRPRPRRFRRSPVRHVSRKLTAMSWQTSLTCIEPNKILVRGYPLDEMMGRLSFAESVYLLLMGELPTPAIGRMLNADSRVVDRSRRHASVDARGAQRGHVRGAAQGLRRGRHPRVRSASRRRHRILHAVSRFRPGADARRHDRSSRRPKRTSTSACGRKRSPPGFGHRFHTRDPRASRLFQMALELELEGEHVRLIRAIEHVLDARERTVRPPAAGQRRRGDCRRDRRPRLRLRAGERGVPDLAAARADRARARGAHAPERRCGRSIRRITTTTARASAACPRRGNRKICDSGTHFDGVEILE